MSQRRFFCYTITLIFFLVRHNPDLGLRRASALFWLYSNVTVHIIYTCYIWIIETFCLQRYNEIPEQPSVFTETFMNKRQHWQQGQLSASDGNRRLRTDKRPFSVILCAASCLCCPCCRKFEPVLSFFYVNQPSYFNSFRPSLSSSTCICWMAILLSLMSLSPCGIPSLMSTALIFSIFERQMSSLIVA